MRKAVGVAILWFLILGLGSAWAAWDGIWKDVPDGQPNDRYALYVQTYTTGSVVVVLLDNTPGPGAQKLYAFLDGDFTDGVEADELGGADAHLSMSNLDESSPTGILTVGGSGVPFDLYMWFEAPLEDGQLVPADGIYKDAPKPADTSFNLYLQTYDPEGSAVAVVTTNGGLSYYIFVDSDFSDGFDAQDDVLGRGAQLTLTVDPVTTSTFAHTPPGAGTQTGQLHQWFQAPAVSYTLSGFVTYAGSPLPVVTAQMPSITAWDNDLRLGRSVVLTYDTNTGAYELKYVPGNVYLFGTIFETGGNVNLPGNYRYQKNVDVPGLTEPERTAFDIAFELILHLTSPFDNSIKVPSQPDTFDSPVTFQWESVSEATHYELKIDRFRSSDHPDFYGYIETMFSENNLMDTTYVAALPASEPQEHYQFYLYAFKNTSRIGILISTLVQGGYQEHYRFRVDSP